MKYLGLHKLLWALLVLVVLIVEMFIVGLFYVLYVIWNFKIPYNFWFETHYHISSWNNELINDKNPVQTFVRRYKLVFNN